VRSRPIALSVVLVADELAYIHRVPPKDALTAVVGDSRIGADARTGEHSYTLACHEVSKGIHLVFPRERHSFARHDLKSIRVAFPACFFASSFAIFLR
jgi:hypothetical protein